MTLLLPQTETARAMMLMVIAMLILPGIDAIAKLLSGYISSGQVAQCRFVSHG